MKNSWILVAATLVCAAAPGCEDNPDGFYKKAPAGAGGLWNDGKSVPIHDSYARNGFRDSFNQSSKQDVCPGPLKQKRWADMVNTPIRPPRFIGGLDLAGGDDWKGLDFRDAEDINCQSKAVSGAEDTLTAAWGDANEVQVDYLLSSNIIESWVLQQGYRGSLDFDSRPTCYQEACPNGADGKPKLDAPNPYGKHHYSIGVGRPVLRDGKTYELNWRKACDPTRPDIMDCWEKQATEMFDALMYTYAPEMTSTQVSCLKAQTCLAKTYSTGDAVFGVRPLGAYMYVPTVLTPQPAPSTPGYLYGFYVKLMPFSAAEMYLKLDEEGPTATARNLGDQAKTCTQRLGLKYGEFLDNCINILNDSSKNDYTRNKLLGGMAHNKEAFDFSIEGVGLDFQSQKIGDFGTVGDDWKPQPEDEAYEFNMDIRASGNVRNEYSEDGKTFTFGGTGAIYRDYARRVQEDIKTQMRNWPQSVREPGGANRNECPGGWSLEAGKCQFTGFEIGASECLMPENAPADWKAAPGCTGFEQFITPASHTQAANANVKRVSLGARAQNIGFKTALKAGDPIAMFCIDASPNSEGKDTGEACTQNNQCWSNHCTEQKCEDVQDYYYKKCDVDTGGLTGSLLEGSWQRVLQYLGGDNALNIPPALRDRKYYFRLWAHAMVKYLKAATLFPTDLDTLGPTACGGFNCEPEPEHLIFEQVADFSDRDNFEYIDRRFVNKDREPLKVEYEILINSSNQQQWQWHRRMTRGEKSLYTAMSTTDRNEPPGGTMCIPNKPCDPNDENLRITNLVGSPVIAGGGWRGAVNGGTGGKKDAHYCSSTLLAGDAPDPECDAVGSVPPKDSITGAWLKDAYGDPILKRYRGAFTGTPFSIGTAYLKEGEVYEFIKSAKVNVPFWPDPYNADSVSGPSLADNAPAVLLDWRPKTPANGIRIPINAQRDKFIPAFTASMTGSSLSFDIDYELTPDGMMKIQGVQSDNYQGYVFPCMDPVTGDLLTVEPYESVEEIMGWKLAHPGAFDACEIIVRPSAYDPALPISIVAKKAGLLMNIGIGSGVGRVTSVEFFDIELL